MRTRVGARTGNAGPNTRNCRRGAAGRAGLVFLLALAASLALPDVGSAQPASARINVWVVGDGGGDVSVGRRARLEGVLPPFVAGQRVIMLVKRGRKTIRRVSRQVERVEGRNKGRFTVRTPRLIHPGRYRFVASHARTAKQRAARVESVRFSVSYPDLDPGDRGRTVRIFNRLLAGRHYHTSLGRTYGGATERAVMAFRKVNGMPRTYDADRNLFRRLAAGRGGFRPPPPRGGFPSTRRHPGLNSLGMYYSVYYNGGEATHGYHSVPSYAASHGCIRNPIPDSRFIYRWVRLGMRIYVYY